jgi:hypothetical protein
MDELKAIHQRAKKFESELNKKLDAIKNDKFEDLQKKVQDSNNRNEQVVKAYRKYSKSLLKKTPPPTGSGRTKPSNNPPNSSGSIGKYLLGLGAADTGAYALRNKLGDAADAEVYALRNKLGDDAGEHIHSLHDKITRLFTGHHDEV